MASETRPKTHRELVQVPQMPLAGPWRGPDMTGEQQLIDELTQPGHRKTRFGRLASTGPADAV